MKTKILFSFLLVFLSAWGALAAAPYCSIVHQDPVRLDGFSRTISKIQNGKKMDTTSLRQEVKFVVTTAELEKKIEELQGIFGKLMKNRDKTDDGSLNITSTLYLTVAKYKTMRGLEKSAKVRFRKYFTREPGDIYWKNLKVSPDLKDKSWLEFKIQHPEYPNVVNKPRLLCWDRDIRNMASDRFFDHKENIAKRLLQLNPGKEEEVQNAIEFFTTMYSNPNRRVQNLFAKTEYERTSYSIKLGHSSNPEEKIDVQLTLDQGIRLTRLADNAQFNVYGADETVIEVKIPVAYSKLTDEDIKAYPELAVVKQFVQWLQGQHNPKYPANKGKMSKIEKKGVNKDDYESSHNFLDILDDLDGP